MNFKDFFLSAIVLFFSVLLVQYLFIKPHNDSAFYHAGQMIEVPVAEALLKPLNTEVIFAATDVPTSATQTHVETDYGTYIFSTQGGTIEHFAVRRAAYGEQAMFPLIVSDPHHKERAALLVALQEETPYVYEFMGKHTETDSTSLTYRAQTQNVSVTKVFKVYHHRYQVDLTITLEPKKDGLIFQPRIIFPGPVLNDVQVNNDEKAIIFTDRQKVDKKLETEIAHNFWVTPSLAGIENRYFVLAAVSDKERFIQRAYFKVADGRMVAFLEGPMAKEITSWTLSFFMGPKEVNALEAVDKRLLDTLDYGFFAWLGRIMMAILNWVYSYLHNYGWAIVVLTILMRLLMAPLSFKGQSYMRKTNEIQKRQQYIEQQYKNDPEMLTQKRQEVMAQAAMPMLAGCAVGILQIPVFLGLSNVLRSSIELYQAPFIWIKDLSAADPYYILPILFGAGLVIMSSSSTGFDPRQRISSLMITFAFVALMTNFSAGVLLFMTTSIWMGIIESRFYKMMIKQKLY